MKNPEYFKEKRKKREELKKHLPTDLQLAGEMTPVKWNFDGKLTERRKIDAVEYQKFFEILQARNKELSEKDQERLNELKQESLVSKQEIGDILNTFSLYEKGLSNPDNYVRRGTAESLGSLVAVNPEMASSLYEKGLSDPDDFVRWGTAKSLGSLASVNPELYLSLYEKGLSDPDDFVRQGTAESLGSFLENNLNVEKYSQELSFIREIVNKHSNDRSYLYSVISSKLRGGESLDKLFGEEYNDYLNLKEKTKEWNAELDETKKIKDVDRWWGQYQINFAELQAIDRKLAASLVRGFEDKGLLALQSYLNIYQEALSDPEIRSSVKELVKKNRNILPDKLNKLLQTAHAYKKLNKTTDFKEILENEQSFQVKLDNHLVEVLAESLDISLDKKNLSLAGWNSKYISNLASNEEMIKSKEDNEETLSLYKEMLKADFEDRFDEFITDTNQKNEVGRDVAEHNQKIEEVYDQLGIPFDKWLNYNETRDFAVETKKEVKSLPGFTRILKERTEKVSAEILFLEKELSPREYLPLTHLLAGAKDKALVELNDYNKLNERYVNFIGRIKQLKEKYSNLDFSSILEHTQHLKEAVDLFKEKSKTETQTFQKGFRIKLWDRAPEKDLFQGNYTHCCIAVGVKPGAQEGGLDTHDPSTIMQYLADKGIQVAEVKDEAKEDPIAQVWLFVSKDELGEPILVADNFEVHQDYVSDAHINNEIRDNMFEFLKNYAKKLNINKVGLGQVGTNDIDYSSMNSFSTPPIDKVGGYLSDYTLDIGGRQGRYYLETYNNHNLAEIMNLKPGGLKDKEYLTKNGSLNIVDLETGNINSQEFTNELLARVERGESNLVNERSINELEAIEQKSFPIEQQQDVEEILATLRNTRGVQILFKEKGQIKGYLSSLPADRFVPPGASLNYDSSPNNLYIESIAGKTDPIKTFLLLKEKAKEAGYAKISIHGINPRLNKILKRGGFKTKEIVPEWYGSKNVEYMELELGA